MPKQPTLTDVVSKIDTLAGVTQTLASRVDNLTGAVQVLGSRVDDVAGAVQGLATHMDERFEQVDKRFEQVDKRFEQVDLRFETLESEIHAKIDNLERNVITEIDRFVVLHQRSDVELASLRHRCERIETKVGME